MYDAFLHPNSTRANLDRAFDYFRNVLRPPENIYDVHFFGNIFEARIGFLAENLALSGIHWNDAIASGLHVLRDAVARAEFSRREAHDGDGLAGLENFGDGIFRTAARLCVRVILSPTLVCGRRFTHSGSPWACVGWRVFAGPVFADRAPDDFYWDCSRRLPAVLSRADAKHGV